MLSYFAPLTVPAYPIAAIPAPDLDAGAVLLEIDQLVTDLDTAIQQRDDAARRVQVLELRIAVARAALQGQLALVG